jgi:hypothetical protein
MCAVESLGLGSSRASARRGRAAGRARPQLRPIAALKQDQADTNEPSTSGSRRQLLSGVAASLMAASLAGAPASRAAQAGFLSRTGAKGPLAQEEDMLLELRVEKEGEVIRELEEERRVFEEEARNSMVGAPVRGRFAWRAIRARSGRSGGQPASRRRGATRVGVPVHVRQLRRDCRRQVAAGVCLRAQRLRARTAQRGPVHQRRSRRPPRRRASCARRPSALTLWASRRSLRWLAPWWEA